MPSLFNSFVMAAGLSYERNLSNTYLTTSASLSLIETMPVSGE
jgi:hypothetical protein